MRQRSDAHGLGMVDVLLCDRNIDKAIEVEVCQCGVMLFTTSSDLVYLHNLCLIHWYWFSSVPYGVGGIAVRSGFESVR